MDCKSGQIVVIGDKNMLKIKGKREATAPSAPALDLPLKC